MVKNVMSLIAGDKLGPYEILGLIGSGGMGEVYHARDTKLDRDVAIKILPPAFSQHPDRLARFEREAKTLAALNHPNIASIFGLEDGAIVMELVEGPTLADRIKAGPLTLEEGLKIAAVIADALEAAHEKGIVHRDLKPANVKAPEDGLVKVLDFGLATAAQATERDSAESANSPTLTMGATEAGVILGTAAYMSPEQAAGKRVDRRADVWSFGVVLWEMLAGKRLFAGHETVSHTLADVLRQEIDFAQFSAPRQIVDLLKRCLDRDAKTRLRDIGEARVAIARYLADPNAAAEPTRVISKSGLWAAWAVAGALLLATAAISFLHFRETPPERQTLRYTIAPPENGTVHSFAVSPDGRQVVIAAVANGKRQLWLRSLDALQTQVLPGTDEATFPFWSPDSKNIAFFAEGRLRRIAAAGGPAQTICAAPDGRGGSWNGDVILFAGLSSGTAIQRVSSAGGEPAEVTKSKASYRFPAFLPGGRRFLFVNGTLASGAGGVYAGSLDGSEERRILADVSSAMFAPSGPRGATGHILFIRDSTLMAVPFDVGRAELTGDAVPVVEGVPLSTATYAPIAISDNGVLLYASSARADSNQIVWYDRSGKLLGLAGPPGARMAALSPDEKMAVYSRSRPVGSDLWLRDLVRGTDLRFTSHASVNAMPVWSPQGDRVAFSSTRAGQFDLYQKPLGGGAEQLLLASAAVKIPYQWSPAGIVYFALGEGTRQDLWVLPVSDSGAPGKPELFLQTQFGEYDDWMTALILYDRTFDVGGVTRGRCQC